MLEKIFMYHKEVDAVVIELNLMYSFILHASNQGCGVGSPLESDSGHVLLLDCTLSLVLCGFSRCRVLAGCATC